MFADSRNSPAATRQASLYFLLAILASHNYVMDFDSVFIVCRSCLSSAIWHLHSEYRAVMPIKARLVLA